MRAGDSPSRPCWSNDKNHAANSQRASGFTDLGRRHAKIRVSYGLEERGEQPEWAVRTFYRASGTPGAEQLLSAWVTKLVWTGNSQCEFIDVIIRFYDLSETSSPVPVASIQSFFFLQNAWALWAPKRVYAGSGNPLNVQHYWSNILKRAACEFDIDFERHWSRRTGFQNESTAIFKFSNRLHSVTQTFSSFPTHC